VETVLAVERVDDGLPCRHRDPGGVFLDDGTPTQVTMWQEAADHLWFVFKILPAAFLLDLMMFHFWLRYRHWKEKSGGRE